MRVTLITLYKSSRLLAAPSISKFNSAAATLQDASSLVNTNSNNNSSSSNTNESLLISESINRWAQYKQTPISIARFAEFGRRKDLDTALQSVKFLRNELPVRLAHMTKEIENLPDKLLSQQAVAKVRGWYIKSFEDLINFSDPEPSVSDSDRAQRYIQDFTEIIRNIHRRHAPVVTTMAQGIQALKESHGVNAYDRNIQYFLDRFYMSRIGIRMLIAQHCEVFGGDKSSTDKLKKGYIGVIDESCNVREIAEDAAANARFLCDQHYFSSPEVEVLNPKPLKNGPKLGDVCFPYVPSHLYHMLFELLKNSMRAVVEHHGPDATVLPKVVVRIMKGEEDLTIKISDEGGGIPRSGMPHLFTYFYTTATPPPLEPDSSSDMNHAPLAGFGYGLPLSRLYARYFGGDLHIISMEGHGTDAYIYLKVAAHEAGEVLPSYSRDPNRRNGKTNDWMQSQIMRSLYTSAKHRYGSNINQVSWAYMDGIYGGNSFGGSSLN